MTLPVAVKTTTVVGGPYFDAGGKPAKGHAVFKPIPTSTGEVVQVVSPYRANIDATGMFHAELPVSVDGDTVVDLAYQFNLYIQGGIYTRRTIQVPYSETEVNVETLVPITPVVDPARFGFPILTTRPTNPVAGQSYYNSTNGKVEFWDAVGAQWIALGTVSGPAGGVLTGTYPNPGLAAGSVDTVHLKAASVTADKLAAQYVTALAYNADLATTAQALGDLEEGLDGKAPLVHVHVVSQVTGLQDLLDGKVNNSELQFYVTYANADLYYAPKDATEAAIALRATIAAMQAGDAAVQFTANAAHDKAVAVETALANIDFPVDSVNGKTGIVVLTAADVGAAVTGHNHDARYYTETELDGFLALKAPLANPTFTGTVNGITKAMVGLGNVDNTTDLLKPISTATQTALDTKLNKAGGEITDSTLIVRKLDGSSQLRFRSTGGAVDIDKTNGDVVVASFAGPGFAGAQTNLQRWRANGTTLVGLTEFGSTAYTGEQFVDAATTSAKFGTLNLMGSIAGPVISPADHNLMGWTFPPDMVQGGTILPTAGLSYVVRVRAQTALITNLHLHLTAGGAALTNAFMTLHTDAGVLVGAGAVSADQSAAWQSGGYKTVTLTTPQAVTPGNWYRVRFWVGAATTLPTLSRGVNSSAAIANAGLAAPNLRFATADAGLTTAALAPNTIGALNGGPTAWWVAMS